MGHSQAEKARSRERILGAAARQVRERGFDSLGIAELMKQAELTHGGFYGHFASRDALIEAALDRALDDGEASFVAAGEAEAEGVKSIVNRYLSAAHRDDTAGGCAIAALATDAARSDDEAVREAMGRRLERGFERMAGAMGGGPGAEDAAVVAWSAMIGAITLSRIFRGWGVSERILKQTRRAVLDLEAKVREQDATVRSTATVER